MDEGTPALAVRMMMMVHVLSMRMVQMMKVGGGGRDSYSSAGAGVTRNGGECLCDKTHTRALPTPSPPSSLRTDRCLQSLAIFRNRPTAAVAATAAAATAAAATAVAAAFPATYRPHYRRHFRPSGAWGIRG
jgi:hypothetical protein